MYAVGADDLLVDNSEHRVGELLFSASDRLLPGVSASVSPLLCGCRAPWTGKVRRWVVRPRTETADRAELDSSTGRRLIVPVRVLDARALKRLDDHREARPTVRWDYETLFGSQD
jgi:hypothetical protein